jgi:hypothetical protein
MAAVEMNAANKVESEIRVMGVSILQGVSDIGGDVGCAALGSVRATRETTGFSGNSALRAQGGSLCPRIDDPPSRGDPLLQRTQLGFKRALVT